MQFKCGCHYEPKINKFGRGQARVKRLELYLNRSCFEHTCNRIVESFKLKPYTDIKGIPLPREKQDEIMNRQMEQIRKSY